MADLSGGRGFFFEPNLDGGLGLHASVPGTAGPKSDYSDGRERAKMVTNRCGLDPRDMDTTRTSRSAYSVAKEVSDRTSRDEKAVHKADLVSEKESEAEAQQSRADQHFCARSSNRQSRTRMRLHTNSQSSILVTP